MNKSVNLFLAFVWVMVGAVPSSVAAGPETPITLDQAVAEALTANLTLRDAQLKSGVKERDRNLAFNKLLPTLTVGAALADLNDTYTYKQLIAFVPAGPAAGNHYFTPEPVNLVLQMNAQFVFSWALLESIRQTGIDYENSRISYRLAAQKLERDVRKAFYQLLVLREAIRVTEHQVAAAEERYQQALTNQKAGQSARLTVLQAKVAWENKKPGLEDLRVSYGQLLLGFEALLGRQPDPGLEPAGTLDFDLPPATFDAEEALARFLPRRIDLQAAQGQVRAADGMLSMLTAQWLPAVGIQYSADPMINDPLNRSWDALTDKANWHQKNGAWTVFVTWKLDNLVPWMAFDNQRADVADLGAQARIGVQGAELAARAEVMTLFSKIRKSTLVLASLKDNVDSALEASQLTGEAYRSGVRSLLEVQDSDVQYQFAQLALLNEKQFLNASLLDLETALNTPRNEIFMLTPAQGAKDHE